MVPAGFGRIRMNVVNNLKLYTAYVHCTAPFPAPYFAWACVRNAAEDFRIYNSYFSTGILAYR